MMVDPLSWLQHLLRQYTLQKEYDFSSAMFWEQAPDELFSHVTHCLIKLTSFFHCNMDVTPYLIEVSRHGEMQVRPRTQKRAKCRDFSMIRDYLREHAG